MLVRKVCIGLAVGLVSELALAGPAVFPHRSQAANPATVALAGNEDLVDQLTLQQRRVWLALQRRDADAFKKLVPVDFAGINRNGVRYGRDDGLQFIARYKIAKFDLSDIRVQSVTRDAAILTYHVKYQIASVGGDEIVDLAMRNVAVFARRDGKWYCVFGEETPAGG